jgi:hypothetical protein
MKLANTLALCLTASMLWNCNEGTRPESDERVPATVNHVTKHAALSAGYQISSETAQSRAGDKEIFSEEVVEALQNAGLCSDFVLLIKELVDLSAPNADSGKGSPQLQKVVKCLTDESKSMAPGAEIAPEAFFGLADKCFCGGTGTLFLRNFTVARYSAPTIVGGYTAPTLSPSPYAAPTVPGYSAPSSPGGQGYSAP